MLNKIRVSTFILILLILVSLSLAGRVFYLLQKEHAMNLALQEELEDIKTKQRITETKLEESKKTISTLESNLHEAKVQIDTLTSNLEQEKTAKENALAQTEQLRVELEQQEKLRLILEDKLTQAQEDTKRIEAQLKESDSKKMELETKIKDLDAKSKSAVELGKIVVSSETKLPTETTSLESTSKKLEGKVLVVNKNYNFAVINLGTKDGIDIGDMLSVLHNNKYIGDVKVEKVHDSMSAAGFVSMEMKDKVNEGDKVSLKAK